MFFSWGNIIHNLNDIHSQAKEVLIQNGFHIHNIKEKQSELSDKIFQVQSKLTFLTAINGFFGIDNPVIYADFYSNSSNFEMVNDPIEYGFSKSKVVLFIQHFTKTLPQLIPILNFDSISNFPLPLPMSPIEYLLCSTIPSIFCHFWCADLIDQYIDFIFNLNQSNSTFSSHLLEMSLINFVRITSDIKFFSQSFGGPILDLLYNDPNLTTEQCVNMIIDKMHDNMFLLPRHVRRLISRFLDNCVEGQIISPSLFVAKCIVSPPLLYPKEWGVIDSKYYIDDKGKEKLKQVSELFLSFSKNVYETNELSYKFNDFVNSASEIDDQRDKVSISEVLPLLGQESISLLFTLLDIKLLGYLVARSPSSMMIKGIVEQMESKETKNSPAIKKPLHTILFSCNVKSIGQFQIDNDRSLFKNTEASSFKSSYISAIFSFFEKSEVISEAPRHSLKDFIQFHKKYSSNINNSKSELLLRMIESLLPDEKSQEYFDVLPSLNDELLKQKDLLKVNANFFLDLVILNQKFDKILSQISRLNCVSINAFASRIFDKFIQSDEYVHKEIDSIYPEILASSERFYDFFEATMPALKEFMATVKYPEIYESIIHHYHCWVLFHLPFDKFHLVHPMYNSMCEVIENADDGVIQLFCVAPAPANIKHLFQNEPLFEEARSLLKKGRVIENPLIALPLLSSSIELLNKMYFLEYESNAQADELTPLIHYLFLTSKIPALFSFIKYLDFYISPLIEKQILSLDENYVVGLTHLINHVDSLYAYLSSSESESSNVEDH